MLFSWVSARRWPTAFWPASRDGSTSIKSPIQHAGQNSPPCADALRPTPPSSMQRRWRAETLVRGQALVSAISRSRLLSSGSATEVTRHVERRPEDRRPRDGWLNGRRGKNQLYFHFAR